LYTISEDFFRRIEMTSPMEKNPSTTMPENSPRRLPTHDEIAVAAYRIYLERGATESSELEDWLQAERDLLAEFDAEPEPKVRAKTA
jgi:hypothetical protein